MWLIALYQLLMFISCLLKCVFDGHKIKEILEVVILFDSVKVFMVVQVYVGYANRISASSLLPDEEIWLTYVIHQHYVFQICSLN